MRSQHGITLCVQMICCEPRCSLPVCCKGKPSEMGCHSAACIRRFTKVQGSEVQFDCMSAWRH